MFSKELTQQRNNSLKGRKEMLQQSNELNIYLEYPAHLMARKRNSHEKYKQIEVI